MNLTLFLCGDVMLGRGIDQLLPHPGAPHLYEPYVRTALGYVELAEGVAGPLPRPVDFNYVWGDALEELQRRAPQARIVNLETSVTAAEDAWPGKGIHYRMHPRNAPRLAAAAPAAIELSGGGRVLVFAYAMESSGVPPAWAAAHGRAGVNFLADLSARSADAICARVREARRAGDIVVISIHWGGNWGYESSPEERAFAHRLVDGQAADVLHGHSSHHPRGIEIYRERPILYGCGDFLNDYEGIGGHEAFRPGLCLMVFPTLDAASGRLQRLALVPMRVRRFRLQRAVEEEVRWLQRTLERESRVFGTRVELASAQELLLRRG